MRQRFLKDTAAGLIFVPPETTFLGPATSATVSVTKASGTALATPVVAATATVDAVSTTLSAAQSDPNAREITLTAVTNVAPNHYYVIQELTNYTRLLVKVLAVNTTSRVVTLSAPLGKALSSADTFKGCEITYSVASGNTSISGDQPEVSATGPAPIDIHLYRAAWSYVIGGVTYTADQVFEINARLLKPTLAFEELVPYLPDQLSHLASPNDSANFFAAMDTAWERILDTLSRKGFKPDKVMDPDALRTPHLFKTLEILGGTWGPEWEKWTKEKREAFAEEFEGILNSGTWYDRNENAKQDEGETKNVTVVLTR